MPAALRVAGRLGVGAIFALRFCKAFREKLHPAPFLFDRAGSKGNRSPGAVPPPGSASNLQLSASCHGLSSLSPPCASAATGRRAAVRPEAGPGSGPGRTPRGRQNLHFQVVLGKSKSSFPPPPFFSQPMRQAAGLPDGVSSSRRDSAAAIGFSAVFTYTTIPCPVVTGGGRYLHRYKFGPLWNESDRPLFSSATAYPLSASPDCRSFGSIRVAHRQGEPIGLARAARVRPSRPIFRSPSGSSVTVIPLRCRPNRSS